MGGTGPKVGGVEHRHSHGTKCESSAQLHPSAWLGLGVIEQFVEFDEQQMVHLFKKRGFL